MSIRGKERETRTDRLVWKRSVSKSKSMEGQRGRVRAGEFSVRYQKLINTCMVAAVLFAASIFHLYRTVNPSLPLSLSALILSSSFHSISLFNISLVFSSYFRNSTFDGIGFWCMLLRMPLQLLTCYCCPSLLFCIVFNDPYDHK